MAETQNLCTGRAATTARAERAGSAREELAILREMSLDEFGLFLLAPQDHPGPMGWLPAEHSNQSIVAAEPIPVCVARRVSPSRFATARKEVSMLRGSQSGSVGRRGRAREFERRVRSIAAVAFAVALLLDSERSSAGVLGIPCAAGSFSANGFEPCSLCPSGTWNPFVGADQCLPCIEGTYAVGPGATQYAYCECRDDALCTVDRCDATTGACTAHDPAPSCEAYAVRVEGLVTQTGGSNPEFFTVGEPIAGSWIVDPSELDRLGAATSGTYPYGVVDLRVRVGDGPGVVEGYGEAGSLYIESTPPRDSDYLDLIAGLTTPGFTISSLVFTLDEGDDPAIVSNAIPLTFPAPMSFVSRDFRFRVIEGEFDASAASSEFTVSVPEPQAGLAGIVAAVTILALRGRRQALAQ